MSVGSIIRSVLLPEIDASHLNGATAALSLDGVYIYMRHATTAKLNRFNFSDFAGQTEIGSSTIPNKAMVPHPTDATKLIMVSDDGIQTVAVADATLATLMDATAFAAAAGFPASQCLRLSRVDEDNFIFGARDSSSYSICNYEVSTNTITKIVAPGFFWYTYCAADDGSGDFFLNTWEGGGIVTSAVFRFLRATEQWRVVTGLGLPGDSVGTAVDSKISFFAELYHRGSDDTVFLSTDPMAKYVQGGALVRFAQNNIGRPIPGTNQLLRVSTGYYTELYLIDAAIA